MSGVPLPVLLAVTQRESGFNPQARSPAGAIGLMQLMPETAKGLGIKPEDPIQNLIGGAIYLRDQINRFKSVPLALAAYNAGPGAVEKYHGVPPFKETQDYVSSIMATLEQLGWQDL